MVRRRARRGLTKIIDEESIVRCRSGSTGLFREEVFEDQHGVIVKYNLAFIHFGLGLVDNGRVLGYDNAHGFHERHWMGKSESVAFHDYTATFDKFMEELNGLKEQI